MCKALSGQRNHADVVEGSRRAIAAGAKLSDTMVNAVWHADCLRKIMRENFGDRRGT